MEIEQAEIAGVCPSPFGHATFVKCPSKTFVIYMDKAGGGAVERAIKKEKSERPLTHELAKYMIDALGYRIRDVLVYHTGGGIFYARLTLVSDAEGSSKIAELDARPSDSFSLALRADAPIYVAKSVLEKVQDASEVWKKISEIEK